MKKELNRCKKRTASERTERHLGNDGVFCLQEFSNSIFVDRCHTEQVLVILIQSLAVDGALLYTHTPNNLPFVTRRKKKRLTVRVAHPKVGLHKSSCVDAEMF
jgi:hypothetical protein